MPPILNKWTCLDQTRASSGWVGLDFFYFFEIKPWLEVVKV